MPDVVKSARAAMIGLAALLVAAAGTASAADRFWPPIVDPPTGQHTPGRWVWGDLVTSDVAVAADFYGQVFGWTFETYGGENDLETYTLALADGLPIGGLVFDQRALKDKVPSARWIGLISVPDVRAAADAVTRPAARSWWRPPCSVSAARPPFSRTRKARRSVSCARGTAIRPTTPGTSTSGCGWTSGPPTWARRRTSTAPSSVTTCCRSSRKACADGVHLVSGGFVRAGIMQKNDARDSAVWLPYLRVADAGRRHKARAAGGKVIREPSAWGAIVAIIADPTGAPVGIAQLLDTEAQR
jgi:uncharacterized protein